jgi:RNA polymerase sigma factor (sigma-70 family)
LSVSKDLRLEQTVFNIHEELISRCRTGDQEAHYKLYRQYSRAMYNVGFRITGNADDADDVLQEAFISAFRNLHHYRGDASFGGWLKRIVVNKAINILQKRKYERLPDNDQWDVAEPEAPAEYREELTLEMVKRAIGQLPDGYRAVLSLYLIEGYDHQEIAEIMGISESTSKSQLNRAKSRLRELLKSES